MSISSIDSIREQLITSGISADNIPGLYTYQNKTTDEIKQYFCQLTQANYSLEEVYGQYCQLAAYIECPLSIAFEYAANAYSLEEWTFSLRNLQPIGGGLYKGTEALGQDTVIYLQVNSYPENGVIDYLCAWDQGHELWMRYYFRFIDAMPTIKKPGTMVLWTNCRHPYYDRTTAHLPDYIKKMQERTDRDWVGDFWLQFYPIHQVELNNLKAILEYRFQHSSARK